MNILTFPRAALRIARQKPKLSAVVALVLVTVLVFSLTRRRTQNEAYSFYEVRPGDFLISVVEGGTLEAVNEISVRSEVEGTARIIFIVPEGSTVKKGDLLVELDSSSTQDAVNQQQINVEKAQFALVQAQQQLDIQKSIVDSEIQAATLKVEFATSDLEKFTKGEALQAQRDAQIEITNVLESLQIAQERLDWSEKLFKEGFETKGNLDKDRLTVSQTVLKLEQAQKALWMIETFDNPKKKRSLEATLQENQENLDRVKLQGERKLAQFNADVETQKKTLDLSTAKLERDKKQLVATKVYAPQGGLVVYGGVNDHFSNESRIEEGAVIRNRQEIIKLPDISAMKVQIKIHETHINQIRLGQPAFVVLDSMPDTRFTGLVNRVAPLPDSQSRWGNPDLKVYATEILITDKLPDLKPGVSARAEVVITNLANVLTVPIQSVTTRKGKQVVFLASAPQEPVPVVVGMYNKKFIEICSGVNSGDRVLLSPPFDAKEKDLGGAIIAEGDTPPPAATNLPPRFSQMNGLNGVNGPNGRSPALAAEDSTHGTNQDNAVLPDLNGRREGPRSGKRSEANAGEPGANRPNREEILKRFDADGDGKLSESEQAAMRETLGRKREPRTTPPGPGPVRN